MNTSAWLTGLLLVAGGAQAQSLAACRALADAGERLSCYDALPLPDAMAAQRFGLARDADGAAPDTVASRITGRFEGWGPSTVFQLANGQRWRVVDGSSAVWRRQDPKVTISRGLLGSYNFSVEGLNRIAKVRRVE